MNNDPSSARPDPDDESGFYGGYDAGAPGDVHAEYMRGFGGQDALGPGSTGDAPDHDPSQPAPVPEMQDMQDEVHRAAAEGSLEEPGQSDDGAAKTDSEGNQTQAETEQADAVEEARDTLDDIHDEKEKTDQAENDTDPETRLKNALLERFAGEANAVRVAISVASQGQAQRLSEALRANGQTESNAHYGFNQVGAVSNKQGYSAIKIPREREGGRAGEFLNFEPRTNLPVVDVIKGSRTKFGFGEKLPDRNVYGDPEPVPNNQTPGGQSDEQSVSVTFTVDGASAQGYKHITDPQVWRVADGRSGDHFGVGFDLSASEADALKATVERFPGFMRELGEKLALEKVGIPKDMWDGTDGESRYGGMRPPYERMLDVAGQRNEPVVSGVDRLEMAAMDTGNAPRVPDDLEWFVGTEAAVSDRAIPAEGRQADARDEPRPQVGGAAADRPGADRVRGAEEQTTGPGRIPTPEPSTSGAEQQGQASQPTSAPEVQPVSPTLTPTGQRPSPSPRTESSRDEPVAESTPGRLTPEQIAATVDEAVVASRVGRSLDVPGAKLNDVQDSLSAEGVTVVPGNGKNSQSVRQGDIKNEADLEHAGFVGYEGHNTHADIYYDKSNGGAIQVRHVEIDPAGEEVVAEFRVEGADAFNRVVDMLKQTERDNDPAPLRSLTQKMANDFVPGDPIIGDRLSNPIEAAVHRQADEAQPADDTAAKPEPKAPQTPPDKKPDARNETEQARLLERLANNTYRGTVSRRGLSAEEADVVKDAMRDRDDREVPDSPDKSSVTIKETDEHNLWPNDENMKQVFRMTYKDTGETVYVDKDTVTGNYHFTYSDPILNKTGAEGRGLNVGFSLSQSDGEALRQMIADGNRNAIKTLAGDTVDELTGHEEIADTLLAYPFSDGDEDDAHDPAAESDPRQASPENGGTGKERSGSGDKRSNNPPPRNGEGNTSGEDDDEGDDGPAEKLPPATKEELQKAQARFYEIHDKVLYNSIEPRPTPGLTTDAEIKADQERMQREMRILQRDYPRLKAGLHDKHEIEADKKRVADDLEYLQTGMTAAERQQFQKDVSTYPPGGPPSREVSRYTPGSLEELRELQEEARQVAAILARDPRRGQDNFINFLRESVISDRDWQLFDHDIVRGPAEKNALPTDAPTLRTEDGAPVLDDTRRTNNEMDVRSIVDQVMEQQKAENSQAEPSDEDLKEWIGNLPPTELADMRRRIQREQEEIYKRIERGMLDIPSDELQAEVDLAGFKRLRAELALSDAIKAEGPPAHMLSEELRSRRVELGRNGYDYTEETKKSMRNNGQDNDNGYDQYVHDKQTKDGRKKDNADSDKAPEDEDGEAADDRRKRELREKVERIANSPDAGQAELTDLESDRQTYRQAVVDFLGRYNDAKRAGNMDAESEAKLPGAWREDIEDLRLLHDARNALGQRLGEKARGQESFDDFLLGATAEAARNDYAKNDNPSPPEGAKWHEIVKAQPDFYYLDAGGGAQQGKVMNLDWADKANQTERQQRQNEPLMARAANSFINLGDKAITPLYERVTKDGRQTRRARKAAEKASEPEPGS